MLLDAPPDEKASAVRQLAGQGDAVRVVALSVGDHHDVVTWAEAGLCGPTGCGSELTKGDDGGRTGLDRAEWAWCGPLRPCWRG
ncbi:hypothetical protein GCM10010329_33210 [Streptomyces spiroverticillatus]|uniref:Uncharacterized protein n=1 Tax=Streptomyces finlayi TaxID=67296 RepID=A0A918WWW3_9ACTN|nr:hypothetical protein [Streptomyces finlayi]GHA07829.1 hypothetical protein GCM10010329_33210 [Streptomyces spiroverticillatus]GHC91024.1 hypothetical protein GCM10010334_25620 [Streptomyces finlayi]